MYVDTTISKRGSKTYVCHMLRTSYRENGKVKHKTICNLSGCTEHEIAAIKLALKHKKNLSALTPRPPEVKVTLGKRIGAVWALKDVADQVGLSAALGKTRNGKLALLQIIARVAGQGSRLSAVRFAESHALCEILGIDKLDENDLYENLAWLASQQERIEKRLFKRRFPDATPTLFLYDVTSSYLEGCCNELGDWGYNRDKKRGKQQIVVGLLAGPDGLPVAVRVFRGNTPDTKTVSEQVRMLAASFGVKEITLVGDRGMLKGPQIEALPDDFRYITAIAKPQIRKMLSDGVLQLDLFDNDVCEVQSEGVRYILRRNPMRAEQMANTRKAKRDAVETCAARYTTYLAEHKKAIPEKALEKVTAKIERLKSDKWLTAHLEGRVIVVREDADALAQAALLDGCYVIKTDVALAVADAQTVHDRYCDLEMLERCFRTMKTTHLELRPVFVRKAASTRGHVFVVMLALLLQRTLERAWAEMDITVAEGIDELGAICMQQVRFGDTDMQNIPTPNTLGRQLLKSANIILPTVLPARTACVHRKKKLPDKRKPR